MHWASGDLLLARFSRSSETSSASAKAIGLAKRYSSGIQRVVLPGDGAVKIRDSFISEIDTGPPMPGCVVFGAATDGPGAIGVMKAADPITRGGKAGEACLAFENGLES